MSTPTDPYSSSSRRPFEDDEILAPLAPEASASSAAEATRSPNGFTSALTEPLPAPQAFASTQGMDPAFDQRSHDEDGTGRADAPQTSSASLAQAIGIPGSPQAGQAPAEPRGSAASESTARTTAFTANGQANGGKVADYSEIDYSFGADDSSAGEGRHAAIEDSDAFLDSLPERPSRTTTAPPATTPAPGEYVPADQRAGESSWGDETGVDETPEAPRGRGWSHAGVLVATLLLVPVAWYLLADASARLVLVPNNPWETGNLNYAALGELVGGLAVVALIWLLARVSSLGAQVVGVLVAIFGVLPLALPTFTQESVLAPLDRAIGGVNDLTANIIHHLNLDLGSGRMLIFGVALLLTGLVSHSARRRGIRHGSATARRAIALATMEGK